VGATEHGRRTVLVSAVAANFGQFGARVAISPFVLTIAATFQQSKSVIGLVLTLLWATYAILQFPSGVLADRYGERRIVFLALGLTAVGSLSVAAAPTFPIFAAATLLLGIGAGLYFAAGTALLDRRFAGSGLAFSLHSSGGPLAGLAVPVVASLVAATYGWRVGVAVGAAAATLALAVARVAIGPTPPASPDARLRDRLQVATVRELLSRRGVAFTTLIGVVGMYVFQSFVSFFPSFLQEHHGLSRETASFATGVAFLLIAVVMPLVGHLADRTDVDVGIAVPMLVTATGFGALLVPNVDWLLVPGVGLVGVGLTWGGAVQSRFMREFADHERGTGFGLVRTLTVLLGSTGNLLTGVLADVAGWVAAMGVVVGLLVCGATLLLANRQGNLGY
jgi:YNFM family putative membrane transporter